MAELIPGFEPENQLERRLTEDPVLLEGLQWGKPREGHPEGSVGLHVADLLRRLEERNEPQPSRNMLRFVALVHDSLKYKVKNWLPRTGENHHAIRARRFAEGYTDDERLLSTIELHDRPYAIWRRRRRTGDPQVQALEQMVLRVADPRLFLRFVELDGSAEGKTSGPIEWIREEFARRGLRG